VLKPNRTRVENSSMRPGLAPSVPELFQNWMGGNATQRVPLQVFDILGVALEQDAAVRPRGSRYVRNRVTARPPQGQESCAWQRRV
jgi:hypothetical protein